MEVYSNVFFESKCYIFVIDYVIGDVLNDVK